MDLKPRHALVVAPRYCFSLAFHLRTIAHTDWFSDICLHDLLFLLALSVAVSRNYCEDKSVQPKHSIWLAEFWATMTSVARKIFDRNWSLSCHPASTAEGFKACILLAAAAETGHLLDALILTHMNWGYNIRVQRALRWLFSFTPNSWRRKCQFCSDIGL